MKYKMITFAVLSCILFAMLFAGVGETILGMKLFGILLGAQGTTLIWAVVDFIKENPIED